MLLRNNTPLQKPAEIKCTFLKYLYVNAVSITPVFTMLVWISFVLKIRVSSVFGPIVSHILLISYHILRIIRCPVCSELSSEYKITQ